MAKRVRKAAVCIPAYNEESTLGNVLEAALSQKLKGRTLPVHVLDDGSLDRTASIAKEAGAHVISHDTCRGLARARNTLLERVEAEFLIYLDADAVPQEGCFGHLLDSFGDDVGAAGGKGVEAYRDSLADRYRADVTPQSHGEESREDQHLMGLCMAVRRSAALEIRGFNEDYHSAGEDLDFTLRLRRAGWRLVYQPEAKVLHLKRGDLYELLRQSARHAFWAGRAMSSIDQAALSYYARETMLHLSRRAASDAGRGDLGMACVGALVLPVRMAAMGLGSLTGLPWRADREKKRRGR